MQFETGPNLRQVRISRCSVSGCGFRAGIGHPPLLCAIMRDRCPFEVQLRSGCRLWARTGRHRDNVAMLLFDRPLTGESQDGIMVNSYDIERRGGFAKKPPVVFWTMVRSMFGLTSKIVTGSDLPRQSIAGAATCSHYPAS